MKRISVFAAALALWLTPAVRAQDAATEERLSKLAGQIEDLRAGQDALHKQVEALVRELGNLHDQVSKPTGNYASQEDLKRVADALKEVNQKRIDEAEKVRADLLSLRKSLLAPTGPRRATGSNSAELTHSDKPENGYEYIVKRGDTLSTIIQAYRDNNVKISLEQVLKANPNLKPERMSVGQKIFIPAPGS